MQETPLELWLHIQFPLCSVGRRMETPFAHQHIPPQHLHAVHFIKKKKKALKADLSKAVGKQIGARVDHLISFENLTESHYRGITVVWVFLCANDAGCGWLGTADARFVTQTGAPGCFSSQPSGHLNRLPSLERRSKYNDEDAENCDNYGKSFYHLPSMRNVWCIL